MIVQARLNRIYDFEEEDFDVGGKAYANFSVISPIGYKEKEIDVFFSEIPPEDSLYRQIGNVYNIEIEESYFSPPIHAKGDLPAPRITTCSGEGKTRRMKIIKNTDIKLEKVK
jgi:hypothetical protein